MYYPGNVDKCTECGWESMAPDFCPVEMSAKPCKWTEKVKGVGPKGEDIWTTKHGTRAELLESIQRDGPRFVCTLVLMFMRRFSYQPFGFRYNYHMWVHQWTSWQYDLDAETFDGETEIVVVTDFSAVYEMKDNVGEKCKYWFRFTHTTSVHLIFIFLLW